MFTWCYCLTILGICNNNNVGSSIGRKWVYEVNQNGSNPIALWGIFLTWEPYVNSNLCFNATLNKEAWQSVSRGAGVMLFWRGSQCKNAKVNKEWLLLRNLQRERACKVGCVVQERESRWASFSSAKAQCVCKDTHWSLSITSTDRRLNGFSNCFYLCVFIKGRTSWLTERNKCYLITASTTTTLFKP